ncbi:Proline 4-hydroxylase (includes Rps23 Pro-64 3,4-dihydroxylase Tpa1), contains SM-20 domain [Roseateles sp. YR242]|uniref:2OG-Fe(II) oxygenase n=1 Tax=Roseateles sp. YR242 TaxID=1855305 RepID=UPI0008B99064|nr:2OG-Fe(II) oxygenase family protein [Roseateles sp. YR242]SEK29741.1 Proline 4-hydroxylase (includes Rps23 Pro-64 3,4-dihydroxylase Tpa1), contains SM-20 domain [Roseateles sp. YR242]
MNYLNPTLDFAALGHTLRTTGRVLIRDFFATEVADALDRSLQKIDWQLAYRDANGDRRLTGEQLRSLTPEQRWQLTEGIHSVAREGFQFSFFSDSLVEALQQGRNDLLARFMRWMADEEFLSRMRQLSGDEAINGVYAQATLYSRGNFLTSHDDHVEREDRRIAYVINLTRRWSPDWGGLLHFTGEDGSVLETFYPHFNSLSLFTVPQPHFVSYVPPFAMGERQAITGWLIAAQRKGEAGQGAPA